MSDAAHESNEKTKVQFDLRQADVTRFDSLIPEFFATRAEFLRRAIRLIHFLITETDVKRGMTVTMKDGSSKTILIESGL
ncbi:MAG TPA: hypothetical protein PLK06_01670 [bacterium]|nr:hypothetical protein [bacterium]